MTAAQAGRRLSRQTFSSLSNRNYRHYYGGQAVSLDLVRSGSRSTFGEVRVLKAGVKDPVAIQKAVAVYTEIGSRHLEVPVSADYKGEVAGPVTVRCRRDSVCAASCL